MALKRLDEEFELRAGTQLLPYMKRLLPSLEGRFQDLEETATIYQRVLEDIRAAALLRMNEILIPATEDIVAVTKLGFLMAPIEGFYTLALGDMTFPIKEGPQQDTFTPSPYLLIEHSPNDYALARTTSYEQDLGILEVTITAVHGNVGPWNDWMVSSTPGMADSTKLYHDAIGPMYDEVVTDHADVVIKHQEIVDAANALEAAGLDLFNYVRRDGATPFNAVQTGVTPISSSNDTSLATTVWARARAIEYSMNSVSRAGDTMTGALRLSGPPSDPMHAVTKQYVDGVLGAGGNVNSSVTISTTNPYLRLRSMGTNENRTIEAISSDGFQRWVLTLADNTPLTGGNNGANFLLARYSDVGVLIDYPITINRATGIVTARGLLAATGGQNITGGFTFTPYAAPTGHYSPNPINGNYQTIANNGAFNFNAPTVDCAIDVLVTNGASAGGITMVGFTTGLNTGDLVYTTNGHRYIFSIRRIAGISTWVAKALQ